MEQTESEVLGGTLWYCGGIGTHVTKHSFAASYHFFLMEGTRMVNLKLILVLLLMCCPMQAVADNSFDEIKKAAEQGNEEAKKNLDRLCKENPSACK